MRRGTEVPVFVYTSEPGVPPVSVVRLYGGSAAQSVAHAHDFPSLVYFDSGGGALRFGPHVWPVQAGDVYLIRPGQVVDVEDAEDFARTSGWGVYFAADALGPLAPAGPATPDLAWRTHPLLYPFARGLGESAVRLAVPPAERRGWVADIGALERELSVRQDGFRLAAGALLTLLLVRVARLGGDLLRDLRVNDEPLLAEVFGVIESGFRQPLSLRDVAAAVHRSPAHLTTTVRRRTGRTVQDWILERRMAEARRLLVQTDRTIDQVARGCGFSGATYFGRVFRRAHGLTAGQWRRQARV